MTILSSKIDFSWTNGVEAATAPSPLTPPDTFLSFNTLDPAQEDKEDEERKERKEKELKRKKRMRLKRHANFYKQF